MSHGFRRVPTRALFAFGLSGFAQNVVGTCLGVHLFIFYTDSVGLAPGWISASLFAATLWDAVAGIAMGQISDHTHSRWGRRRPYVLAGALPFAITFALVLRPPEGLAGAAIGAWLAFWLVLQFTAANVVHVPVLGLIPEMAQSYHERTRMAAWREALGNVGDLVGLLLPFALRWAIAPDAGTADAADSRAAYATTGAIGAALAGAALLVTWAGTYEDARFQRSRAVDWRAGLAALRRNEAFRVLSVSSALAALALAFVSSLILYVLEYVGGIADPLVQGALFVANVAGCLVSYPFWVAVSRRRGKAFAYRLGLAVSTLAFGSVFLLEPGRIAPLVAVMGFAGAANVGFWLLLYALNADIADLDELETGERREGLFAGFAALLRKCAFAVAAGSVGIGLQWIGYVPHERQSAETMREIQYLFALPTTALVAAAWLVFRRFPLSPEHWAQLAVQLEQRRAARGGDASEAGSATSKREPPPGLA